MPWQRIRQMWSDPSRAADVLATLRARASPVETAPHDVEVLSHDVVFAGPASRELDYFYYELIEFEGDQCHHYHKAVGLLTLDYIPREFRETVTMLDRMITALAGLHDQRADFVSLVAGMFEPVYRGVYQCYGVQGYGLTKEQAVANMRRHRAALQGVLANFQQSRFVPLRNDEVEWLRRSFQEMGYVLVGIGQPEPRRAARGMSASTRDSEILDEQVFQGAENLYRALQALGEEFVHLTLAVRLEPHQVNRLVEKYGRWLSDWASRQESTRGVNVGISLPLFLSGAVADAAGTSYGASTQYAESEGVAHAESVGHTDGVADGVTEGQSESVGRTQGVAHTQGAFASQSQGVAESEGYAHGAVESQGQARTVGQSDAAGTSHVEGRAHTVGAARTQGRSHTSTQTVGSSLSVGQSQSETSGRTVGISGSGTLGSSLGVSSNATAGVPGTGIGGSTSMGIRSAATLGTHVDRSQSHTAGESTTAGVQVSQTEAHGSFSSTTHSVSDTESVADGTFQSHTNSLADTRSQGQATSEQWSQGLTRSRGWSQGESQSTTLSESVSQVQTRSQSQSHVVSQADSVAQSEAVSRGRSVGQGQMAAQNLMTSRGGGLGAGLSPSISLSESWRIQDRVAARVTQLLELQEQFLADASARGGWYGDTYLFCRTSQGAAAAQAALVQAFRGELAVTTFHARQHEGPVAEYLRLHGRTFVPSLRPETAPGAMERYRDANLWTQGQLAALTTPLLLEGGRAVTVQTRMPPYAARPDHEGEVLLGRLINHETGAVTAGVARLRRDQVSNTLVVADTGYGKSVLATWLEKEFHLRLGMRVVVLDFGFGHRTLMNLARPGRYEQYSLYVGGPRPIHWNLLQLPRRIAPEDMLDRVTEIVCLAGRMGPRQLAFLRRGWERLWMQAGVLPRGDNWDVPGRDGERLERIDQEIQRRFRVEPGPDEPAIASIPDPAARQQLAIARSQRVDLHVLYTWLELYKNALPASQGPEKTSLDGLLGRLRPLAFGELGRMYGRGAGSIAVEDLGWPDGVVVLEGGSMAAQTKAIVLGVASWIYYQDCVVRRVQGGPDSRVPLALTIEEANKVLGTADFAQRADDPLGTGDNVFDQMIRDARKYLIYMLIVGQTPSAMGTGILGSCNTVFAGRLKMAADRDVLVPMYGKVEKGFVNVEYLEHLSTLPIAQFVCTLGVTTDRARLEPRLLQTLLPGAVEPSNEEVERYFRTYGLPAVG